MGAIKKGDRSSDTSSRGDVEEKYSRLLKGHVRGDGKVGNTRQDCDRYGTRHTSEIHLKIPNEFRIPYPIAILT